MREFYDPTLTVLFYIVGHIFYAAVILAFIHIFYQHPRKPYLPVLLFILYCIVTEVIFRMSPKNKVKYYLFCFICITLMYLVILLIKNIKIMKMKSELPVRRCILISMIPLSSIVLSVVLLVSNQCSYVFMLMITIYIFLINLTVCKLFYDLVDKINQNFHLKMTRQQNLCYEKQLKIMMEAQNRIRIFRHDCKNMITVLKSMLEQGKIDQVNTFLADIGYGLKSEEEIASSGNIAIDALINYKYCCEKHQKISWKVSLNIPENLEVDSLDIAILLGNLLDNAMDALNSVTTEKWVVLNLSYDRGILYIHLENPYEGERNMKKNRFVTTKKDQKNHGIGIASAEKIAAKYHGMLEFSEENQVFEVDAILYLEHKETK